MCIYGTSGCNSNAVVRGRLAVTCIHIHTHTCTHGQTTVYKSNVVVRVAFGRHVHIHTYTHTCTHGHTAVCDSNFADRPALLTCIYVHIYTPTYIQTHELTAFCSSSLVDKGPFTQSVTACRSTEPAPRSDIHDGATSVCMCAYAYVSQPCVYMYVCIT